MNKFTNNQIKCKKEELIRISATIADIMMPIKITHKTKYNYTHIFTCIYDFMESGLKWIKYRGTPEIPFSGKYLNEIHNNLVNAGIYEEINKEITNMYLKKGKEQKLKYQYIDSSFVQNKKGSIKNNNELLNDYTKNKNYEKRKYNESINDFQKRKKEETFIDFNRYNGRKKYIKMSIITDSYGTHLASIPIGSKEADTKTLIDTHKNLKVNLNTKRNSKINRYKQTFIADSGYDSKSNKKYLAKQGYNYIIKYNKRRTTNKKIIKKNVLKGNKLDMYKKRYIIESFNSWFKNYSVLDQNYQKTIKSYYGLFLCAASIMTYFRI